LKKKLTTVETTAKKLIIRVFMSKFKKIISKLKFFQKKQKQKIK